MLEMEITMNTFTETKTTRFLDRLEAPNVMDKDMYHLLNIEPIGSLCDLYVECVHQHRSDKLRRMIGLIIEMKLSSSRS